MVPMLTCLPTGYSLVARDYFGPESSAFLSNRVPILGYSAQHFILVFGYLNPFFDAMTTLLVVKAYRDALKLALGRLVFWKKPGNRQNVNRLSLQMTSTAWRSSDRSSRTRRNTHGEFLKTTWFFRCWYPYRGILRYSCLGLHCVFCSPSSLKFTNTRGPKTQYLLAFPRWAGDFNMAYLTSNITFYYSKN